MTSQTASDSPEADDRTEPANCDLHGAFDQRVTMLGTHAYRSRCPECAEETRAAAAAKQADQAARDREMRLDELRRDSQIPLRYQDSTLDAYRAANPSQKRVLAVCERYAAGWQTQWEEGRSLVLVGGPGTGKTHLACGIGLAVMASHLVNVRFSTATSMLRDIRSTYQRSSERSEAVAVADYTTCDLLILDEIGVQLGSEYEKTVMFDVMNERYQAVLPTILISNLSAQELEEYLGQRVMDRMRESGVVIPFTWESYRGKGKA